MKCLTHVTLNTCLLEILIGLFVRLIILSSLLYSKLDHYTPEENVKHNKNTPLMFLKT